MELTELMMIRLIEVCEEYCKIKNLLPGPYLEGILDTSKLERDPYVVIDRLIEYHTTWIAKGM